MASLFISAAHKSSGKTTVTLGLCRALTHRGLKVQAFKKGPDYIDPIWHTKAAGRPCYNLDFRLMAEAEIRQLFAQHAVGADIGLVEGNLGLYDGMDLLGQDSNAALARLLGLPVVLVIDSTGTSRGVAPLLLGYRAFDPGLHFAGVILNKVAGTRHEDKLRKVIEHYTDFPILGVLHKDPRLAITERHLGLIPGNEAEAAEERIEAIAAAVAAGVDLDALTAAAAPDQVPAVAASPTLAGGSGMRIGIAYDQAFGFYYNEDLDSLRASGVTLVAIDFLRDRNLPDVDALIIGGGFPESFIAELAANQTLKGRLREAIEAGLPVYAECGGLMYLSRSIRWDGQVGEMLGIVPGDTVMGERPVGRGYAGLRATGASPLADIAGSEIQAHEFHHSRLENLPEGLTYAYEVTRGHGIDGRHDGYCHKNLIAAYCHRRGSGEQGWISPFLAKARAYAENRNAARIAA